MIFITIGFQEPFDRLIEAVDNIAPYLHDISFVAQVSRSNYVVRNMKTLEFLPPAEFNTYISRASLIVSHAGMGTIISSLELGKPIVVFPRLAKFRETRNDHQVDTAKCFEQLNYVYAAYTEVELKDKIIHAMTGDLKPLHTIGHFGSAGLIESIQSFIE